MVWAPLAAELLVAGIGGEPLPLERELVDALDPARFLLRDQRKA
jgi:tRNA 5-methylaminomethyl-2-thiouridine biosynthesis bifunctional protein